MLPVIFGEIIPQSICVRYGLPIGAWMSPLVLVLMYIMAPVAWPTAKLLDRILGEDHGTTYKKAGLKTLVTLHRTLGEAGEQLNSDEVTIISAVLDLKAKPIGSIMTPMADVFTMSADTVLDEQTMDIILGAGYSRIPIYAPDNEQNFVGMLLVKILITYDPEDCKRVRDFALATLPETRAETSCLDIVNFFQEGKSHMVLVSESPGENYGALGVVTLEDVIEELIGEYVFYSANYKTLQLTYRTGRLSMNPMSSSMSIKRSVETCLRQSSECPKAQLSLMLTRTLVTAERTLLTWMKSTRITHRLFDACLHLTASRTSKPMETKLPPSAGLPALQTHRSISKTSETEIISKTSVPPTLPHARARPGTTP